VAAHPDVRHGRPKRGGNVNSAVALVRSYLHINGYFTVSEMPVIRRGKSGLFHEVTDIDILALRFPAAGHIVSRGQPGPHDDLHLALDPALDVPDDRMDFIIGEVKEGKPRINPALLYDDTLYTALIRAGHCPPQVLDRLVEDLQRDGEAFVSANDSGIPARVRLVAFGDGEGAEEPGYTVVPLSQVAKFVQTHLRRYHQVLHPVRITDPALGLLHLLEKVT
jgi:hypothetical protein